MDNKKTLTPTQSYKIVKNLLKEKKKMTRADIIPGNIIFTFYNAKYPEYTYDRTPLALVLKSGKSHTLVINFHWIPIKMRIYLIKYIIKLNKRNIKNNKPLDFSYKQLKPMLKKLGYAPCIRLYINKRIGSTGVVIPPERLMEVAKLKTETFTHGKYSAEELFVKAHKKAKSKPSVLSKIASFFKKIKL